MLKIAYGDRRQGLEQRESGSRMGIIVMEWRMIKNY
jgi:hypothetical protein